MVPDLPLSDEPAASSPLQPPDPAVPTAHASDESPTNDSASQTPRRRGRAWIWVLVSALSLSMIIGACTWSMVLLGDKGGDGLSFGNGVAVITIDGPITGTGSAGSGSVTPEGFLDLLTKAEEDSSVKAIVLRVDSPGGTVAASEEIALYVKGATKPIVVSVGDVDASGAYMVSSQADRIIALPGSAVGSIGVIIEIANVNGLLDKLGVKFKTITAGEYKGVGSPYEALTSSETALIQSSVDEVYVQFIDIVAEGRHMKRSEVESLATGWAWNGTEAKKLGLVDEIGTYQDALDAAAKMGGIQGDYDIVKFEDPAIDNLLGTLLGIERRLGSLGAATSLGSGAGGSMALPR